MPSLLDIRSKGKLMSMLPHYVLIDGQLLGVMKREVKVSVPPGHYRLTIRSMYRFIESTVELDAQSGKTILLTFGDSERLWNWLFNLDIVLWVLKRFVHVPEPWGTVYEIASNGFFAVWLLRVWIIRKRYFSIKEQRL